MVSTPEPIHNRAGLAALRYRVGTHSRFLQSMKARLATTEVERSATDGTALPAVRPLAALTTRDPSDFSIALLDAWATLGDVLTFYQERIANECYLTTATERRSVLELARLVGYTLRPGVAATAYLAYTLEDKQTEPVTIAAGARAQSVPGPDETAQTFETSDELVARREWNDLRARRQQPQLITLANALSIDKLHVAGVSTGLKPGDKLLLVFSKDGRKTVLRSAVGLDTEFEHKRTVIALQPVKPQIAESAPLLEAFLGGPFANLSEGDETAMAEGAAFLREAYLGMPTDPESWVEQMDPTGGEEPQLSDAFAESLAKLRDAIADVLEAHKTPTKPRATSPDAFVNELLVPPAPQARNALQLRRNLAAAFGVAKATKGKQGKQFVGGGRVQPSDNATKLLVGFAPKLKDTFYAAWAGARVNVTEAPLLGVYALRSRSALFGAASSTIPKYSDGSHEILRGTLLPPDQWTDDWKYDDDETGDNAFLDQGNDAIGADGYVLVDVGGARRVLHIVEAAATQRSKYNLNGPATRLRFELDVKADPWRKTRKKVEDPKTKLEITDLRKTQLYVQSEPLTLADEPIASVVGGQEIQLDGLYNQLESGRWMILTGERAGIDGVAGVRAAELLMISGLRHGFDPKLPGDQIHTTLLLATATAHQYKRDTVVIYGNVVKATQGETRHEPLGNGDGAQTLQTFTLKQPPLTFVPAATAVGAASTLHVRVNEVEWHERDSFAALGPHDHGFVTRTDDAGATTIAFGDGQHGARLPTGIQNVSALYRNGIGKAGNVKASAITSLLTRPLGVKEVTNPLRASGGADKESRDLARENAPLSVMALDRLVSLSDYADFTRRFAGIAKALAARVSDGHRQLVQLTIAGVDDVPIDRNGDLYANLLRALHELGDPDLGLQVDLRERKILVLSAGIKQLRDYSWESVVTAVRTRLLSSFGFDRRRLGQPVSLCEVIAATQQVAGVEYVDVDVFGAVAEMIDDLQIASDGSTQRIRRLPTQKEIAAAIGAIVAPSDSQSVRKGRLPPDVDVWPGGSDRGLLRPAELAVFTPDVPDTLILNQLP
jgi:hypothetical protein